MDFLMHLQSSKSTFYEWQSYFLKINDIEIYFLKFFFLIELNSVRQWLIGVFLIQILNELLISSV